MYATLAHRRITLVDTAGMRKYKAWDTSTPLEALAVSHAKRAIAMAHVAMLVVDAREGVTKQDLSLAQYALDEGRALVVAVNKTDLLKGAKNRQEVRVKSKSRDWMVIVVSCLPQSVWCHECVAFTTSELKQVCDMLRMLLVWTQCFHWTWSTCLRSSVNSLLRCRYSRCCRCQ